MNEVMPTGKPFFKPGSNLNRYTYNRPTQNGAGYEIVNIGGNNILKATVTTAGDPVRAYPDIFFAPRPGNFYTKLKVSVSGLDPNIRLSANPNESKPWLSIVGLFDKGGPDVYHASVMLKLEGYPDRLRVVTTARDAANTSFVATSEPGAPLFHNGAEIAVFVDVKTQVVKTYQDGILISTGKYYSEPVLAGAHWLWYSAGNVIGEMTNDDVELGSW